MTNPYGPSGPSNHLNPGRGSGQSRPVGASMQGGGQVSGGERLEQSQTTARRPRSSRLIVGVLVVALLGIGSFVVFHEGGIGLGGSNSPTPTARATGNGEQYSTQYLDGAFTVNTTRIEQGPVDKEGADTLLVTYTLVNNTAITQSVRLTLPKLIQKGTELPNAEFEPGQEPEGLTKWNYDIASGETMTVTYAYRYAYPGETVTFRRWNTIDEDPNAPLWSFDPQDQQSDETADDEDWVWHPY
ncbi:DUF5067 domain-containing protein [Sanguibacter keddieii]|uniref:DUF5067 domain-containing protein n=1 Tax=Sanguibacter keddieii TaxID=60920 RepID=UPI0009E3CFD6|nr:DUF5067 domain-containing protein [Sanguibacter keddieii]